MMVKEMQVHQLNYEWYTIKTSNSLYQWWKLLMISLSFITSFTYAYYAAFLDYMDDDEKNMLT